MSRTCHEACEGNICLFVFWGNGPVACFSEMNLHFDMVLFPWGKVDRNLGQVVVLDLILEVENLLFSRLQLLAEKIFGQIISSKPGLDIMPGSKRTWP